MVEELRKVLLRHLRLLTSGEREGVEEEEEEGEEGMKEEEEIFIDLELQAMRPEE